MSNTASIASTAKPAASTTVSPWLSAAAPISQLAGSVGDLYATSQAQKAQAEYAEGIYNVNAKFAEVQAEDSIARGEFLSQEVQRRATKQISLIRAKAKVTSGAQRASFAAQGIEATSGSAADVLAETELLSAQDESDVKRSAALDVITIRNNAWREAWGYKTQAQVYGAQGRIALMAGETAARNTVLSGGIRSLGYGLDAYNQYYKSRGITPPKTRTTKTPISVPAGSKFYAPRGR